MPNITYENESSTEICNDEIVYDFFNEYKECNCIAREKYNDVRKEYRRHLRKTNRKQGTVPADKNQWDKTVLYDGCDCDYTKYMILLEILTKQSRIIRRKTKQIEEMKQSLKERENKGEKEVKRRENKGEKEVKRRGRPRKIDLTKADSIKTDLTKADSIKTDLTKADSIKTDLTKADSIRTNSTKADLINNGNKPEKRKRGRPRKNSQLPDSNQLPGTNTIKQPVEVSDRIEQTPKSELKPIAKIRIKPTTRFIDETDE